MSEQKGHHRRPVVDGPFVLLVDLRLSFPPPTARVDTPRMYHAQQRVTQTHAGFGIASFGLGLRTQHYPDFLREAQAIDWLEIITDNYLVDGGKPLVLLDQIRASYPMVMHGVAMSIGAVSGIDEAYLKRVKALADRIEPLWMSDHLCWIGGPGPEQLHDLYPLPYTDEAARHVIAQIKRIQDVLQRRFVIENVSSYIDYKHSASSEWQFLSHIANEADCLLLLDVNNVYVSSVNHRFDPLHYLSGLPANRIAQIHLAGHSDNGDHIIDTHDHPVAPAVWSLYREACRLFGSVPAMIERDDNIPALSELLAEVATARSIATEVLSTRNEFSEARFVRHTAPVMQTHASTQTLRDTQQQLADYVLARSEIDIAAELRAAPDVDVNQRVGIYKNAYRARLAEVLADTYAKTVLYMGSDLFDRHAREYAIDHPPRVRSLNRYGAGFAKHLHRDYPDHPELMELAQLDWDLRACFDGPDVAALDTASVTADCESRWMSRSYALHPSLVLRDISTNTVALWRAIDADTDVPEAVRLSVPVTLATWRKALQPHFKTLETSEAVFIRMMTQGHSIADAAAALEGTEHLAAPMTLARWLSQWWEDGFLAASLPERQTLAIA